MMRQSSKACAVSACLLFVATSAAHLLAVQKTNQSAKEITAILTTRLVSDDFDRPMNLKEALVILQQKLAEKNKRVSVGFIIDNKGFSDADPDLPDILDSIVRLKKGKELSANQVLSQMLSQIKGFNATFLVREGFVEITPKKVQ